MLFVINKKDMDKSIVRFTWIEPHITHGTDNTITLTMLDLEVSYKMFFICFTLPHALKLSPHTQDQLSSPKKKDISCRVIKADLLFLFFSR